MFFHSCTARQRNRRGYHYHEESSGRPSTNKELGSICQSVSLARKCHQSHFSTDTSIYVRRQAEFHKSANEVLGEVASSLSSAAMSAESDYMSSR
jgi:hypothetical protein